MQLDAFQSQFTELSYLSGQILPMDVHDAEACQLRVGFQFFCHPKIWVIVQTPFIKRCKADAFLNSCFIRKPACCSRMKS